MYSENENSTTSSSLSQTDDLFMKEFKHFRQFKDLGKLKKVDELQLILTSQLNQDAETLQKYNLKVYENSKFYLKQQHKTFFFNSR